MTNAEKEEIREKIEDHSIYTDSRYIKWRNKIFKRDGHACQFPKCKWPQGTLNAHHIHMKWYKPEWIFKLTNGITLCKYHHSTIHKLGSEKYVSMFEDIALQNTETPKVRKKAKKLSRRSTKTQIKNARKSKKKRIIKTVKSKMQLIRTLKYI